jgi:hypothetical protein
MEFLKQGFLTSVALEVWVAILQSFTGILNRE